MSLQLSCKDEPEYGVIMNEFVGIRRYVLESMFLMQCIACVRYHPLMLLRLVPLAAAVVHTVSYTHSRDRYKTVSHALGMYV